MSDQCVGVGVGMHYIMHLNTSLEELMYDICDINFSKTLWFPSIGARLVLLKNWTPEKLSDTRNVIQQIQTNAFTDSSKYWNIQMRKNS